MRTTDVVRERALALAAMSRSDDEAVDELVQAAMGRRVAIVMARQELEQLETPDDPQAVTIAASLLDRALQTGAWSDAPAE